MRPGKQIMIRTDICIKTAPMITRITGAVLLWDVFYTIRDKSAYITGMVRILKVWETIAMEAPVDVSPPKAAG